MENKEREAVYTALQEASCQGLLPSGRKLLVAVSGGADSLALLHALLHLSTELGLGTLIVAHVDHGLRPDSNLDAQNVRRFSEDLGLDFYLSRVKIEGEGGLQAAARKARYDALEKIRRNTGCDYILTAHSADDQAETVLLRIARGTSISGLAGIRPLSGCLIRPLLSIFREELADYARRRQLPVREDPSNLNKKFQRVRARHDLLPHMEDTLGPGVKKALCRLSSIAMLEDSFLEKAVDKAEQESCLGDYGYDVERILAFDEAIIRRLLARLWQKAAQPATSTGATPPPVDKEHIERLRSMLMMPGSCKMNLPGGVSAELSCDRLFLDRLPRPILDPFVIQKPGEYELSGNSKILRAYLVSDSSTKPYFGGIEKIRLPWPLKHEIVVRGWRNGDRLVGGEKVSEILRRARVPRPIRPRFPVLLSGELLLWVVGLRSQIQEHSGECLEIVLKQREGTA